MSGSDAAKTAADPGPFDRAASAVIDAVRVSRVAVGRRDLGALAAATALGYGTVYLAAIGQLSLGGDGVSLLVVDDPASRALRRTAAFSFEPVALVGVGPVEWLFAPVNVALGLGLGALVGSNLAVALLARRHPAACDAGTGAVGAVAGIPALLSGAACCGPTLLIALGVAGAGAFVGPLAAALPLSALLLVVGLVYATSGVAVDAVS